MSEVNNGSMAAGLVSTPWGPWWLVASPRGVVRLALAGPGTQDAPHSVPTEAARILARAQEQLQAYLDGKRCSFDLPLDLPKATLFQRRVWGACAAVPYGATVTYGALALSIGSPQAARAVGQALGSNPVPVLIPCHRVIASDGSLGGYGGGLALKRALLALERTVMGS